MTSAPHTGNTQALAEDVQQGRRSAVEVTEHFLSQIQDRDPDLKAFLHVDAEQARQRAREVDGACQGAATPLPLAGVPVAVKDNLCTRDLPTTCASRILEGYRPPHDATVVERLRAAGAVLLGKTNLDEFAMGASTENSGFHPTRHPTHADRVPGGSSGGSACAVAAGLAPLALGSDTGGSVRQPAAFCGLVGMRPSYGRVSRYGLVAFASSLDQVGPLTRSVADARLLQQVIEGEDPRDSTSRATTPIEPATADLASLRIGIPKQYRPEGLDPAMAAALDRSMELLRRHGATLVDLDLPLTDYAIATYYLVVTAEASSNLARFDGVRYGQRAPAEQLLELYEQSRGQGLGEEVKRRILLGTFGLSAGYQDAWYKRALEVRSCIRQEFAGAFQQVDVILGPTTPTPAFRLGEKAADPLSLYLCDVFTAPSALAGLPGLSLPAGKDAEGLPLGVQLLGPVDADAALFDLGEVLERGLREEDAS